MKFGVSSTELTRSEKYMKILLIYNQLGDSDSTIIVFSNQS